MSWGSESRRGDLKGFSRKPHSKERKYAQEFLFNPPNDHDDRMSKVYSPEEEIFGQDNRGKLKKHGRNSWKKCDSDDGNDLYGGDWTKELGINRKVLFVDQKDRKSIRAENKVCSEQALLEEFDKVERDLSRTVSFKKQAVSSKSENFRKLAHISQPSSDFEDVLLPPAPPPPDISLNVEAVEMQIEQLDREFERIILHGSKSGVDLDLIEKKSEERRILKNTLKKIKKQLKSGYRNIEWVSVHQKEIFMTLKEKEFIKPSFMIAGKFKDLDQAKEYFGKFGALSKAEWITDKIRLEYYDRSLALKALEAKHSKNIEFFFDPHPEKLPKKHEKSPKREDPDDYTNNVIDSYFNQRSRHSPPSEFRANHFEETSCIQSQRVVDWPRREEKHPKIKKESKYSSSDFKPNKQDTFSVIITNKKQLFHTEEEVYEYFISFGDVSNVSYKDGSEILDVLDSRKDIQLDFESGHSLLLAVNHQHHDITVDIADECKTYNEHHENVARFSDSISRKRKKSRELSCHYRDVSRAGNSSPKHKKVDNFSDKENDREYGYQDYDSHEKIMTKSYEKKHAFVPQGHNKKAKWECQDCGKVNHPADIIHCYNCKKPRQGNWICFKCDEINTPDKLVCYKRRCSEMRKGNWVCADRECNNINWSRSLHCYRDGCYEVQPGAWNCKDCANLNFKDNNSCYSCKHRTGMRARKRESFHERSFAKDAELEKQRQAFNKIHEDENRNDLGGSSFLYNERLRHGNQSFDHPRNIDGNQKPAKDWASDFAVIKQKKDKQIDEDRKKARVVQNKLLALAGDYQSGGLADPKPGPSGFGRGRKSNSIGFGKSHNNNGRLEEVVDIADSDEEPSVIDKTIEENITYKNANLVPIAPRKSKLCEAPPESSFDDVLMEKFKHGKPCEQAQILKKFNIIQLESPPNLNNTNIVEIDLASESEDEAGRFSDGSSIHIEEDAMEVDQGNAAETGFVGAHPCRNDLIDNVNNQAIISNMKDQELINQIVHKDLENINLKNTGKGKNLAFDPEEEDIVILSDEESTK